MAKISSHGREIGTIYTTTGARRYMSDGVMLINSGHGWKVGKRGLAAGAYERQKARQDGFLASRPALAAYRKALHSACGLSKRWKLHDAIVAMPDDADGVWSTVCDGYDAVSADLEDIVALCQLYRNAVAEAPRLQEKAEA